MISFKPTKEEKENFYKYLWRVGTAVENGTAGCNWSEAGKRINAEWDKDYTSSAYRKPVQYAIPFYENVFCDSDGGRYLEQILHQKDELYKIKRQMFDQRREYNKILAQEARADHLANVIAECAERLTANDVREKVSKFPKAYSEEEAVLFVSDWHYGMVTDNIWNKFNTDICRDRVYKLTTMAIEAIKTHNVRNLKIVCLGDFVAGAIHTSCRVASEELVCDQLMQASELLAGLIITLSEYVEHIDVYATFGNHGRTIAKKEDNIHDDNMERIIPWYLKERLSSYNNIKLCDDSSYPELVMFDCCGYSLFAAHGDLESFDKFGVTANTISVKKFGRPVDYAVCGDKHFAKEMDNFGIETIQVASLCGSDEYANTKRLYSHPGQTLLIFRPNYGRICTYNIKLDVPQPENETVENGK